MKVKLNRIAQDQILTEAPGSWVCDVDLTDQDILEYKGIERDSQGNLGQVNNQIKVSNFEDIRNPSKIACHPDQMRQLRDLA